MANNKLTTALSSTFYKVSFQYKKHSPEILVGLGIVGSVAATVMACVATLKVDEKLKNPKENIEAIKADVEEHGFTEDYTERDYRRDISINYAKGGLEIIKLYAPALAVEALSVTAILSGHNILRKRYVTLAAAYTALDGTFNDYRNRVITRFGEDLDKELRYNIRTEEVEETVVDEKGKEKKVKKTVEVIDGEPTLYSRFFDKSCAGWKNDVEYVRGFLEQQRKYMYELLKLKGRLYLNELYSALGMRCSHMGEQMGWIYDPSKGDEQIDLGIYNKVNRRFVNGYETVVLIDPNVTYIYKDTYKDDFVYKDTSMGGLRSKYSGNAYRDAADYPELYS